MTLPLTGSGISLAMMKRSKMIQTTYFTKVGYVIGQLGLISCFDLHHMVLRQGLTQATLVKGAELSARITPLKPDPWAVYAPSCPDPRLIYVVHDGRLTSPIPVALTVEDFDENLKLAESWHLSSSVNIDIGNKEVTVPQWLFDSRNDLTKPIWGDSSSSSEAPFGLYSDLSLLKYIHSKVEKERADLLQPLIEASEVTKTKKVIIIVRPDKTRFGYNFSLKKSTTGSPKTSPKGKRRRLTRESSHKFISPPPTPTIAEGMVPIVKINYTFTPETLTFVKQQAPLLAALVHLLSSPGVYVTGKTRKTGLASSEQDKDDQNSSVEESVTVSSSVPEKKGFIQSIRNRVSKAPPAIPAKRMGFDDKSTSQWQQTYEDVLSHFSSTQPMYQYLVSRLSCFQSLIQWDESTTDSQGAQSPSHGRKIKEGGFQIGLRTLAALPSSSEQVGEACSFVMKKLLEEGRVVEGVKFLTSEPVSRHFEKISFLSDMIVSCAFVTNYREILSLGQSGDDAKTEMVLKNPVTLLSQLSDPELASRLTLASLSNWPVDVCVDMLSYCLHHLPFSSILSPTVKEKLDCIKIYSIIMATCESPLPGYKWESTRSPWKKWADLAADSESRPDYVLRMLLTSKAFGVVRQWAAVHKLGAEVTQQIEVEYLSHLLEGEEGDPIAAQQVGVVFDISIETDRLHTKFAHPIIFLYTLLYLYCLPYFVTINKKRVRAGYEAVSVNMQMMC